MYQVPECPPEKNNVFAAYPTQFPTNERKRKLDYRTQMEVGSMTLVSQSNPAPVNMLIQHEK